MGNIFKLLAPVGALLLLQSCAGNVSNENKTTATDTAAKARWINPRKGKIWGKVNFVQIPQTAYENHILGEVKSVTYKDYVVDEKGEKKLDDSGYNVYDRAGHLIDQNEYAADGNMKWKCIYKYDDQNRAISYDLKFKDSKENTITIFSYDEKGRKIADTSRDENKKYTRSAQYKYDERNNETEVTVQSPDGKYNRTDAYKYDSRNYQVELQMTMGARKVNRKTVHEYDADGNLSSAIYYMNDTVLGKQKTTYDNKNGLAADTTYTATGQMTGYSVNTHDDWGNITSYLNYKPDGTQDTARWNSYTEYVYDDKGNAVKETSYKLKGGKKVMTDFSERKFEYYK